jgi:hypothetical protein
MRSRLSVASSLLVPVRCGSRVRKPGMNQIYIEIGEMTVSGDVAEQLFYFRSPLGRETKRDLRTLVFIRHAWTGKRGVVGHRLTYSTPAYILPFFPLTLERIGFDAAQSLCRPAHILDTGLIRCVAAANPADCAAIGRINSFPLEHIKPSPTQQRS